MKGSLSPLVRFELSRLGRRRAFWTVWGALAAWAALESFNLPGDLPSPLRLWALPVVYLAGWALADDLRSGALDVLLGTGATLPRLLLVRFAVVAGIGLGTLVLLGLPALLRGGPATTTVTDLAVVVVYWAALGAALGFFAGAGGLTALAAAGGFVELWWLTGGSVWLAGGEPTGGVRGTLSVVLHLGSPFPAAELPFGPVVFPHEWLRLVVAATAVVLVSHRLSRISLFVREDL